MPQMLYHAILPDNHEHHVSIDEDLKSGISHLTKSNYWYGNGGEVKLHLTEQLRPSDIPLWVDFKKAVGINLHPHNPRSFCFPVFIDIVLIFDGDITISIYDQAFYEDLKDTDEEALNFDTGKPEVLVFEPVPKEIIQLCEV